MYQVVNRDNKVVEFDVNKIINAISKAFDSLDKLYNRSTLELLAASRRISVPRSRTRK